MRQKYLSKIMIFIIALSIAGYVGYRLGDLLDFRYNVAPVFTILGTSFGLGIGGFTVYSLVRRYFQPHLPKSVVPKKTEEKKQTYPVIEVSIDEVRKAVRSFSNHLPKGVYRTILVQEDNSIDFTQLTSILGGIPSKKFYMSKETYDLFEENEKHIPIEMDIVQKAVDQYVKDHKEYPMLPFDPHHRVNYYQLLQDHYIKKAPETQFYITDLDGLITNKQPQKKNSSHS